MEQIGWVEDHDGYWQGYCNRCNSKPSRNTRQETEQALLDHATAHHPLQRFPVYRHDAPRIQERH